MKNFFIEKIPLLFLLVATLLNGGLQVEARNIPTRIVSQRTSVQQFENAAVTIGALVTAIEVCSINTELVSISMLSIILYRPVGLGVDIVKISV